MVRESQPYLRKSWSVQTGASCFNLRVPKKMNGWSVLPGGIPRVQAWQSSYGHHEDTGDGDLGGSSFACCIAPEVTML